ncbi:hypothetical protein [Trichormus azollae]|jgi:hypothetical protein|uniref:hypothetical protein n=1 Tax=Trichormus azollae TaxID=1164 RepID=UPI0005A1FBEA|nr:hypothetical protein [Trichormus azollae]
MTDLGIKQIEENNWLELLSVWLNLVHQGIRTRNLSDISLSLQTSLLFLSQISSEETFIDLLHQGWCAVLQTIAQQNPQIVVN